MRKYVIKRDDGLYFVGHWRGQASTTDNIYSTPLYEERGAKSARGWLLDKERWSVVPVEHTVVEAK
jgi:hypothetical protein